MPFKNYQLYINEQMNEIEFLDMKVSEIVSKLFHSRDVAHLFHLKTKKYNKHKALQEYYENVIDLIDDFCEQYQENKRVLDIKIDMVDINDINLVGYFEDLLNYLKLQKEEIFNSNHFSNLQAIIDDILGLIAKLLYLLKLK